MLLASRIRLLVSGYPELLAVLAAAVVGLSVQPPLAWAAGHQGISILLAVLVFATAVTIEPAALRRLTSAWRPLLAALAAGIIVLPALSWAVSRIVAAGPLRDGVMTVGLAPCEIASVATTAMAGGEAALSAGVLIGSTMITIVASGPILALESGHAGVHPGSIIASLALVVALPLAAGIALRARITLTARTEQAAATTAVAAVAALVALIAAEVHLSTRYLVVALALAVFLAGSALTGWLLSAGPRRPAAVAVLLTTSMRDFAIAAGLATAAFGTAAAAPLGLYGIFVLIWGTAAAGILRRRHLPLSPSLGPVRINGTWKERLGMQPSEIAEILNRPISQELLARDLTRLAYVAKDGTPRSIPIAFTWNGTEIVMCTAKNAPKLPALRHNPAVALTIDTEAHPPKILLIRGRAELEVVEGIPDEFLQMNGTYTMTPEQRAKWEADVRSLYDGMVRIVVTPTWAKLIDFETTLPSAVEELARQRAERQRA